MDDLSTLIGAVAGVILSLAFSYLPGLAGWYGQQTAQVKSLIMLLCLALASVGVYGVTCWELFEVPGLVCSETGIKTVVSAFVMALAANQSTYLATRRL